MANHYPMEYPKLAMEKITWLLEYYSKFEDTVDITKSLKCIERACDNILSLKEYMEDHNGTIHPRLLENTIAYTIYALNSVLINEEKESE